MAEGRLKRPPPRDFDRQPGERNQRHDEFGDRESGNHRRGGDRFQNDRRGGRNGGERFNRESDFRGRGNGNRRDDFGDRNRGDFKNRGGRSRFDDGDWRDSRGISRGNSRGGDDGGFRRDDAGFRREGGDFRNDSGDARRDNFRRDDSELGSENSFQREDNFRRGNNFRRGDSNFRRGDGNFRRDDGNFRRENENFRRDDGNFRRDDGNFRREGENFRREDENFRRGGGNFRRDEDNFRRDDDNFRRDEGYRNEESAFRQTEEPPEDFYQRNPNHDGFQGRPPEQTGYQDEPIPTQTYSQPLLSTPPIRRAEENFYNQPSYENQPLEEHPPPPPPPARSQERSYGRHPSHDPAHTRPYDEQGDNFYAQAPPNDIHSRPAYVDRHEHHSQDAGMNQGRPYDADEMYVAPGRGRPPRFEQEEPPYEGGGPYDSGPYEGGDGGAPYDPHGYEDPPPPPQPQNLLPTPYTDPAPSAAAYDPSSQPSSAGFCGYDPNARPQYDSGGYDTVSGMYDPNAASSSYAQVYREQNQQIQPQFSRKAKAPLLRERDERNERGERRGRGGRFERGSRDRERDNKPHYTKRRDDRFYNTDPSEASMAEAGNMVGGNYGYGQKKRRINDNVYRFLVPAAVVKVIIGKGGQNIKAVKSMVQDCKISIYAQGSNNADVPKMAPDRVMSIQSSFDSLKVVLPQLVPNMQLGAEPEEYDCRMLIPAHTRMSVNGKHGSTLARIQSESNSSFFSIFPDALPNSDEYVVKIINPTIEGAARAMIDVAKAISNTKGCQNVAFYDPQIWSAGTKGDNGSFTDNPPLPGERPPPPGEEGSSQTGIKEERYDEEMKQERYEGEIKQERL